MPLPTPTTSAAALLAQAQARFQASVSRTATAVAEARARVDGGPESAESLAKLEADLRRVQGWAASFGLRELTQHSGRLATRVRRWADDPEFERGQRGTALAGGATRLLTVLTTEWPTQRPTLTPVASAPAVPAPVVPAPVVPVPVARTIVAPDVVVVQDDPRMQRLLMFALEQAGLRVMTVDGGPAALDTLRRMQASPGRPLVILDVELQGLDGHDVHETLRAERPGMFSFVFTAAPWSDGERMRALNAGALDYLMRPITLRTLVTKIPEWLDAAPTTATRARHVRAPA